jgi:1-deoxy-D-xylulose-5-phosphate reductoisomerase
VCLPICTAPAVYNAANEEAVEAFHAGELSFLGIVEVVEAVLDEHVEAAGADVRSVWSSDDELTLERVLAADAWARQRARQVVTAIAEREHAR